MSITPHDLGNYLVAENCYQIKVNELVSMAQKELKLRLIQAQIEVLGTEVTLTSSKTQFAGERFWFVCPLCQKRVGILYKHPIDERVGCRNCFGLQYRKQRFKGMIESFI